MNAKQLTQLTFVALASLGVYMFVASAQDGELRAACSALCALRPDYVNDNRRVPDFELTDLDGKKVSMRSFRGKTVVLNFWTKTCPPCLEEMPSFAELANIWKDDKDKVVLSVAADMTAEDTRTTLKAVLGREPPFTVLVDPELAVVNELFGTKLYPETWIIDPEGIIRARVDTARNWAGSVALDVVAKVSQPGGACPVTFRGGRPEGESRGVCGDVGPNLPARGLAFARRAALARRTNASRRTVSSSYWR
ncbi:MAG TPA: TlpA disulfide reductase family protein [Polyangiaceae bacterium]|nr:TlpA disulfide reductase family protein [Polyangiaceae bacterium]